MNPIRFVSKMYSYVFFFDKQGTFITPLKGVMNQKMPFYGLHDPSHLVCLSRNRMYVNLMNTDTGNLSCSEIIIFFNTVSYSVEFLLQVIVLPRSKLVKIDF